MSFLSRIGLSSPSLPFSLQTDFHWRDLDNWCNHTHEIIGILTGVINGTAPNPIRLGELCQQLGDVLGRPSWLPVPDFAIKAVLGEGACVVRKCIPPNLNITGCQQHCSSWFWLTRIRSQVLDGQKVLPARATELGFPFKYRYVKDALRAILSWHQIFDQKISGHVLELQGKIQSCASTLKDGTTRCPQQINI